MLRHHEAVAVLQEDGAKELEAEEGALRVAVLHMGDKG